VVGDKKGVDVWPSGIWLIAWLVHCPCEELRRLKSDLYSFSLEFSFYSHFVEQFLEKQGRLVGVQY
jgi:hypothetical protein